MKKIYLLIVFVGLLNPLKAQDWLGFHSSNYAGVQGISFQPASIADSRYKFQMNLIGISAGLSNNYLSIPGADFKKFDVDSDRLLRNNDGKDKGGYITTDIHLPFSLML